MKKRKWKSVVSVLIAFCMILSLVPSRVINAVELQPEDDPVMVYAPDTPGVENGAYTESNAITIAPGKNIIIDSVNVTFSQGITIEEDGTLEINSFATIDSGSGANGGADGAINAANGAKIILQNKDNKPSSIALKKVDHENGDALIDMVLDEIDWSLFAYDNGEWVWVEPAPEPNRVFHYSDEDGSHAITEASVLIDDSQLFVIEGANVVITGSLTMKSNCHLDIFDITEEASDPNPGTVHNARLTYGSLSAEDGAGIFFGNKANIPVALINSLYSTSDDVHFAPVSADNIDENGIEIVYVKTGTFEGWKVVGGLKGPSNPGGEELNWNRLKEELESKAFAYGDWTSFDLDNDGIYAGTDDIIQGMSSYLYDGNFKVNEGRYQREGEAIGLVEDRDGTKRNENIAKIQSYMTCTKVTPEESIGAMKKDGSIVTLYAYNLTLTIPSAIAKTDNDIVINAKAYWIDDVTYSTNSAQQVIIKVGDEYYIRNAGNYMGQGDFEKIASRIMIGDIDALTVVTNKFTQVSDICLFGNNAEINYDEVLSDESATKYFVATFHSGMDPSMNEFGGKVAIYNPGFTGVVFAASGESRTPAAWDGNTNYSIRETGENSQNPTTASLFFGYSEIELDCITKSDNAAFGATGIDSVSIVGDIPENAVYVTKDSGKYKVHFLSDYYDTVVVKITYNMDGGDKKDTYLQINRVGIVIENGRTAGDSPNDFQIHHGHVEGTHITLADNNGNNFNYVIVGTYYFPSSAGELTESDTSLYVTFTYKDGKTEQKIVKTNYFTPATSTENAMADYYLYIGYSDNSPVKVEAIAVENVDANGRYNGAKLGAGKGVAKQISIMD